MSWNKIMVTLTLLALTLSSIVIAPPAETEPGTTIPEVSSGEDVADNEAVITSGTRGTSSRATTLDFTENSTGLPTNKEGNYITFGDFNKDGDIDFAFGGENYNVANTVGLYAYTGDGGSSWTSASTGLWTGLTWGGVWLADADEDGDMELYATDEHWGSSNGSGLKAFEYRSSSWTDKSTYVSTPVTSGRPDNVYLANITGDSRLDIVVSNNSGNGLAYYENTGGNPATWKTRSSGLITGVEITAIAVADLNKDGLKDIVAIDYSGGEYIYIQKTSGGLWGDYSSGINPSGTQLGVTIGDVNNDTHMDIIFGGHGNGIKVYLGNSGGSGGTSFTWTSASTSLPTNNRWPQIQVADIDLDGDLDIIAPEAVNTAVGIEIFLGNGTENPGTSMGWTKATTKNLTTSGCWYGCNLYDINKDGSLDIVGASWDSGIKCWLNKLSGFLDDTPPAAVTLTHTNTTTTSITVNWTAPANNGTNASSGPASEYDLRYSTSTITLGNWASATQVTGEPAPATPGTAQGHKITGLSPATTYYIALRSRDARSNWSPLSNILINTTLSIIDTNPPGQITDLVAESPTNNSIILKWTAPANNGTDPGSGPVVAYDIRYYSASVTNGTWPSATLVLNPPTPGTPGTQETFNVTGLSGNTTYHFAVKARDGKPNWNYISNSASNKTLPDPDVTPPAAISDLATADATINSLNLSWTATGDDGSIGRASYYDIRYATTTITDLNWASAQQVTGEPLPKQSGNPESFKVTGLNPDTLYYFAVKAADENLIWSPLSNIASGSTLPLPDTTAPAAITDLSTDLPTETSLRVKWTAPGDDGNSGIVSGYEIRYATTTITSVSWSSAILVPGAPSPVASGTAQTYVVTGLVSDQTYYFAVKSYDEVPNWSPLSNIATGTTLASTDTTAPGAISDLAAATVSSSSINLTWTAPGDDGNTGMLTGYDIRYSTVTITDSNWASATEVAGEPLPKAPGTSEHFLVPGLFSDTTYYFAIKGFDEKPNFSPLSNIASAKTQVSADTTPPAKIDDLAADATTESTATLSWTAVGDDGDTGTATAYDLRYSEAAITDTNWNVAQKVKGLAVPKPSGEAENVVVTGLDPDTTYYFAIKAADEVPNWSPLSNIATGKTTGLAKPSMSARLTPQYTTLHSNESMSLSIEVVAKLGLTPLSNVNVVFSSDNPGLVFTPGTGRTDLNGELSVTVTAPEVYEPTTITIFADATLTDYKSNRTWTEISVTPVPPEAKFNLKITEADITLNKTDIVDGDSVTISATITNDGETYSSLFIVQFFDNDDRIGSDESVSILRVDETITIDMTWTAAEGEHTLRVKLTPSNPAKESDAADNEAELTVTVKKKDEPIIEPPDDGKDDDEKEGLLSTSALITIIIVIIIIVIVIALLMMRKKKQEAPAQAPVTWEQAPQPVGGWQEPVGGAYPGPGYPMAGQVEFPPPAPEQPEGVGVPLDELPQEQVISTPAEQLEQPQEPQESEQPLTEQAGEPPVEQPLTEQPVERPVEQTTEPEPPADSPPPTADSQLPTEQLVPCPTCGNQITVYATPCPHCNTVLNWG